MKQIAVGKTLFALVDDSDFAELSRYRWFAKKDGHTVYARRKDHKTNSCIYMHRQILGLTKKDKIETDHVNGQGCDNRRCNLRTCTHAENQHNRISVIGSSVYKGVCRVKGRKKWKSYIRIKTKLKFLGYYDSEKAAAIAYNNEAKEAFGEFARLNNVA